MAKLLIAFILVTQVALFVSAYRQPLHLKTATRTTKYPSTCYCEKKKVASKQSGGECLVFTDKAAGTCAYEACAKSSKGAPAYSFVCSTRLTSGMMCIRRIQTSEKVVEYSSGRCRTEKQQGHVYVPYTKPTPTSSPSPTPKLRSRPKGSSYFWVVSQSRVVGWSASLSVAKSKLASYASRGGSRCIFETIGGEIQQDPHMIAGEVQEPPAFKKYWSDLSDIRRMYDIVFRHLKRPDRVLVVALNQVVYEDTNFSNAMQMLTMYQNDQGARAIFKVENFKVLREHRKINWPRYTYWKDEAAFDHVYKIAVKWMEENK